MSEALSPVIQESDYRSFLRKQIRKACLLGTIDGKSGLEVLANLLGYKNLSKFHREELARCESINPYIAKSAIKRAEFPKDEVNEARVKLSEREFNGEMKRLWLWSRGFYKTTLISTCHTIQLILIDPNIRILIMHNVLGEAIKIMGVIRYHFIQNDEFREMFSEYCPEAGKTGKIDWGKVDYIEIPNRTLPFKEGTVEVCGVDSIKTGAHFDYMKKDDLVTKESVATESKIRQAIEADDMSKFLFDDYTTGCEDYIGTRYHFADLYAKKLQTIRFQSFRPGILNGEPTFPEKFDVSKLEEFRKEVGSYEFASQIMLNPIDPSQQKFRQQWIKWYDELPKNLYFYMAVDPATKKKKKSDYTAIMVIGADQKGNWYICDIVRDKLDVKERIDLICSLADKWKIGKVIWESVGFQETDIHYMKEMKSKVKFDFFIDEIKTQTASKEDRISALQPWYERGQIFWPSQMIRYNKWENKSVNYIEKLQLEYETFPMCEHDDLMDCHSMFLKTHLMLPTGAIEPKGFDEGTWGFYLSRHRNITDRPKVIQTRWN